MSASRQEKKSLPFGSYYGPNSSNVISLHELHASLLKLSKVEPYPVDGNRQDFSIQNVCGVFKKGEKSDPSNYRPISLTCIASKILEHIVHSHVMKHFEHYNVLTDCQHGFRSKRSTELQYSLFMVFPVPYNKTNLFMLLC